MVVAIERVARYARISGPEGIGSLFPEDREILTETLGTAEAMVERYAPEAPEVVRDQAKVQTTAYLYAGRTSDDPPPDALRHSGSVSLLAPWRVHRAGVVEGA